MDEEESIISLIFHIIFKLAFVGYFIYHIAFHQYGIFNYKNLQETYANKKFEFKKLEREFSRKQNKVDRLQVDNLDLDLFDEEVRKNLGVVGKNEIVIFADEIKAD